MFRHVRLDSRPRAMGQVGSHLACDIKASREDDNLADKAAISITRATNDSGSTDW